MSKAGGLEKAKRVLIVTSSVAAIAAVSYGLFSASRSPLFTLKVVEVADQPENAPVDAKTIADLAALPVGKVNLFELELESIEKRILVNPWIREVHLQKRFPQTLTIAVTFRDPQAVIQPKKGNLSYVDIDGRIFGEVNLAYRADLPLLSGFDQDSSKEIADALQIIRIWEEAQTGSVSQISSISYENERGYRVLVTYPLLKKRETARSTVELGQDLDTEIDNQLTRLSHVFRYLSTNDIAARQIWADTGKKIVVKIPRRS